MFHVKRLSTVLLSAALAAGCAGVVQEQSERPAALASAIALHPGEIVVRGADVDLTGFLYRPATYGAHPAILQLHGCGGFRNAAGLPNESYRFWAEHWVRQGFVVLLLDSFTPRGEKTVCSQRDSKIRADRERVRDAYAGLSYLAGLTGVDPARIFLQGWSHGGTTTLNALAASAPGRRAGGPQFRAAVAYYPGCRQFGNGHWSSTTPLLIQSGAADDWTPAIFCEQLAQRARKAGAVVEIDVYPNAHHSFDRLRQPIRFRPDVGAGGKGAHAGTNPEARQLSLLRTTEWVLAHSK